MDELTSVFYALAEAYRFIGSSAVVLVAFTSLLTHPVGSAVRVIARS